MKISATQIAGIILILALVAVFLVIIEYQEPVKSDNPQSQANGIKNLDFPVIEKSLNAKRDPSIDINNPRTCKSCHPTIYNEWMNSGHRKAHIKQLYRTFAFFKTDGTPGIPMCENCHISESTLEVAPLAQPVSRRDAGNPIRSEDGIDCASCHRKHTQIVGVNGSIKGCFATSDKFLRTSKYCGGCHKTFLTNTLHEYDEWLGNKANISVKKNCHDCHMLDASGSSTGEKNGTHKSHLFPGGYNKEMIMKAIDYDVEFTKIEGNFFFVVKIINKGTGHHFPTGTAKRRVKLEVKIKDASDKVLADRILYLQKPPRFSDSEGTQVPDRETRAFYFQFDSSEEKSIASLRIIYQHYQDEAEENSFILANMTVDVPDKITEDNR